MNNLDPHPPTERVAMFDNTPTETLISMNITYLQEYREDPTPAKLQAVIDTDHELTRRNA